MESSILVIKSHSNCSFLIVRMLLAVPLFLLVDSEYGDFMFYGYGQQLALLLTFIGFIYAYRRSTQRVKCVMLIGMVVGMAGEILFSLGLGMYHYRLENVPLWVIFAHGIAFAAFYKLSHTPSVWRNREHIQKWIIVFAIVYAFFSLTLFDDWYGFLCTIAFFFILFAAKKSRLFFLIMYVAVCYIELVGTLSGCWYWPEIAFGLFSWLPSGNPPSGIPVFYFLFDAAVFYVYMYIIFPRTRQRYQKIMLRRA